MSKFKVNQWQVLPMGMAYSPDSNTIEFHTMPDGVVMWRIPEPVIEELSVGLFIGIGSPKPYFYSSSYTNVDGQLKGKTKDGKPFGVWTVDFGSDT